MNKKRYWSVNLARPHFKPPHFKPRFLKYRKTIKTPKGEKEVELVGSTAKLKTNEFVEFNENVKRWAAVNLNCYIPDPSEVLV